MSDKNDLYLFTAKFPFGTGETFLENELPVLTRRFSRIYIIPFMAAGEPRSIPANATIIQRKHYEAGSMLKSIPLISTILVKEFLNTNSKTYFLSKTSQWVSFIKKAIANSRFINDVLAKSDNDYSIYSFWMNDWVLALSILRKQRKHPDFVFRCGGFDIWDERHEGNYLPFRYFNYSQTSAVLPNSRLSEVYLKEKNMFPEKISCAYWGTTDHGLNPYSAEAPFTIVSCSNVIPLKRVELIIEILKHLSFPVRWIHFGDGDMMSEIQEKARMLPSHISAEFKGRVENRTVIEYYKGISVSLFITTSSTEGLPVSIQEAISFGIPAVATNVGGIPEVVNEITGILIEKEFDPAEVAARVSEFKASDKNTMTHRKKVRAFWEQNFNAETVYNKFVDDIERFVNRK